MGMQFQLNLYAKSRQNWIMPENNNDGVFGCGKYECEDKANVRHALECLKDIFQLAWFQKLKFQLTEMTKFEVCDELVKKGEMTNEELKGISNIHHHQIGEAIDAKQEAVRKIVRKRISKHPERYEECKKYVREQFPLTNRAMWNMTKQQMQET